MTRTNAALLFGPSCLMIVTSAAMIIIDVLSRRLKQRRPA